MTRAAISVSFSQCLGIRNSEKARLFHFWVSRDIGQDVVWSCNHLKAYLGWKVSFPMLRDLMANERRLAVGEKDPVFLHVSLSSRLLEHPHDMVPGLPYSEQSKTAGVKLLCLFSHSFWYLPSSPQYSHGADKGVNNQGWGITSNHLGAYHTIFKPIVPLWWNLE